MTGRRPLRSPLAPLAAAAVGCLAGAPAPADPPAAASPAAAPAAATPGGGSARLAIVDRAIAFHGGEAFTASETRLRLCSKSGCFRVRARLLGGLFDYEVSDLDARQGEQRVRHRNDRLEWWQAGEPRPVEPGRVETLAAWVMERVYFVFLPFRLNDPSCRKEDLGIEEFDGRRLHKVKVTFEAGSSTDAADQFLYWFDPETARLERFAYHTQRAPGRLRLRRLFNYRRVGGILFYDQENYGLDAPGLSVDLVTTAFVAERMQRLSTVTLEQIEVEVPG